MRKLFLVLLFFMLGSSLSFALSPQAADFIQSIGMNPTDADVVAADKDGAIQTTYRGDPVSNSLEELAAAKKANAVKNFVFTRKLIRQLKANFSASNMALPSPNYDALYLTESERALVGKKVVEELEKKTKK